MEHKGCCSKCADTGLYPFKDPKTGYYIPNFCDRCSKGQTMLAQAKKDPTRCICHGKGELQYDSQHFQCPHVTQQLNQSESQPNPNPNPLYACVDR